jgi:hypothetical protein
VRTGTYGFFLHAGDLHVHCFQVFTPRSRKTRRCWLAIALVYSSFYPLKEEMLFIFEKWTDTVPFAEHRAHMQVLAELIKSQDGFAAIRLEGRAGSLLSEIVQTSNH